MDQAVAAPKVSSDTHILTAWIEENLPKKQRRAFADRLGISESHLSLICRRLRGVSPDLAVKIEKEVREALKAADLLMENQKVQPRARPRREAAE